MEWKLNALLGNNDRTTNRPTDQPIYRRTNGSKGSFTSNMILNCSLTLPEHKSQMTLRRGHCLSMPSITYHNATYLNVPYRVSPCPTIPYRAVRRILESRPWLEGERRGRVVGQRAGHAHLYLPTLHLTCVLHCI